MIDMDQLEASLDLALTHDLRIQRPTVASDVLPPAPTPVPAPVAPRCVPPPPSAPASVPAPGAPGRRRSPARNAAPRPRPSPVPAPAPSPSGPSLPAPPEVVWDDLDIEQHSRAVVELIGQGKLAEADLHIAAHAELAGDSKRHRQDTVGWAVMRALLAGRERAARAGIDDLQALGRGGDPVGHERYRVLQFAVALTWGDDDERYDVLDHCRERAYSHGELAWQGRCTLLLAHLGRSGEAGADFDATVEPVLSNAATDPAWLDLATDLAEAAAVLGDPNRGDLARQALARAPMPPVAVVGPAWVCKGSVARYQALAATATGAVDAADGYFRAAAEAHRRLGAEVLLARTLREWGHSLAECDPHRSAQLVRQGTELAHDLGLPDERQLLDHAC